MTKLARERREERFRQVSAIHESVYEFFRTTDPDTICNLLKERRETNATLEKQITDLRGECADLEKQADRLKSQIEEAEYTSAKGIGGSRLILEGRGILDERYEDKKKAEREREAVAQHQKQVGAGCHHLQEILALVEYDGEEVPEQPNGILVWVYSKLVELKEALENEDQDYLALVNKQVFALQKAKEDAALEPEEHKKPVKPSGYRRSAKDKLDETTRVLSRNAVKMLAAKTVQAKTVQSQAATKKGPAAKTK
jgi:hypothetical protein